MSASLCAMLFCIFERHEFGSDNHCGDHDQNILDNVLTLKRRREESLPSDMWQKRERHGRGYQMYCEEEDSKPLPSAHEENNPDCHFKKRKEKIKIWKRQEGEGFLEKIVYERLGRTNADGFEQSEPKIDNENSGPGNGDIPFFQVVDNQAIKFLNPALHFSRGLSIEEDKPITRRCSLYKIYRERNPVNDFAVIHKRIFDAGLGGRTIEILFSYFDSKILFRSSAAEVAFVQ